MIPVSSPQKITASSVFALFTIAGYVSCIKAFSFPLSWKYALLAGHPHRLRYSLILRSVMVIPYFSSTSWHTAARVQSIKLNFIWSGDLSISILRINYLHNYMKPNIHPEHHRNCRFLIAKVIISCDYLSFLLSLSSSEIIPQSMKEIFPISNFSVVIFSLSCLLSINSSVTITKNCLSAWFTR